MAAPFPSGMSQYVQTFLPLTDLGYKMYMGDVKAEHTCLSHVWMVTHTNTYFILRNTVFTIILYFYSSILNMYNPLPSFYMINVFYKMVPYYFIAAPHDFGGKTFTPIRFAL